MATLSHRLVGLALVSGVGPYGAYAHARSGHRHTPEYHVQNHTPKQEEQQISEAVEQQAICPRAFSVCKTDAKILISVLPPPPHLAHHP